MVESSLGRNKLRGSCLWISKLRKKTCQGGPHITGDEAGGKKKEGGRMLPWRTTSVILVSFESGISGTLPNRNFISRMFNLIAWHSTMSFFHVGPFQFAWDIRALLCQKWVWTISCRKKKKEKGLFMVCVCDSTEQFTQKIKTQVLSSQSSADD